ncbi:uncharacterized protein LOC134435877 [Engraulis encrasicolus]|uniref:uncharacterized protein LOC134435877 n=1 Tax=Engraulis encrasicolus TaxID=184585 RepID=UPI002FD6EFD0
MDTDDTYDWKGNMNPIYALIHTNSLEAENKLVAFQREVEALRREQENTLTEMEKESTLDDRFLGELKDQDIEICKLQDYVNQLQKENSEAKMLLEEQEKKHNITMDAFKQELHANSLDAVNQLAAIQREVEALQNELEYTVAEMEKKQRCLDEFMDKDLEVGKLQDYVHQLQRENREAKMLLAKQEKNHTITVDAIKQETNNKLVATQRQVEALKRELANTVIEMDEKER